MGQEKQGVVDNNETNKGEEIEPEDIIIEDVEENPTTESNADDSTDSLKALQEEKDALYDRMLRVQAEYDNFKRRTQKEKASDLKYKSQELVNELLPVLDNFERAIQIEATDETKGIIEGITMVYNQFLTAIESQGVEVIEAKGEEFDPNIHHAVMQVEDDEKESNTVVEELQKGYMLKDKVIRAAMVKVNK